MAKHRPKRGRIRVADLVLLMATENYTRSLAHLDAVLDHLVRVLVHEKDGDLVL